MKASKKPQEIETVFVVCSNNPQETFKKIEDILFIANCKLENKKTQILHDFYFDDEKKQLQAKKLALRLRFIDETCLIALKGESKSRSLGSIERLELEFAWSAESLGKILKEISYPEIDFNDVNYEKNANPRDLLKKLGFGIIQERKTIRNAKNILCGNGILIGEIASDLTIYSFNSVEIHIFEIEIESKDKNELSTLEVFISRFEKLFLKEIQRWKYTKLETGKALESLISTTPVTELVNENKIITLNGYKKIESYLTIHQI